ncbi:ATP-binding protein [Geotalea toluenoxydans]|uniref:ATP-binding protein n=1 Tax=Geotalea toluenoxydans TaxID=421624 RepID=UPI001FB1E080|nr:ATP-binding protein [Geotalea toluenoxydans]
MDENTGIRGMVAASAENAQDLAAELSWFADVLDARIRLYFNKDAALGSILEIAPPDISTSNSCYGEFVRHYDLSFNERLVLVLALIPHLRPQLLDVLWSKNETTERGFTEFGGLHGNTHGGFIPSGETAAFILAGDDLGTRFEVVRLFAGDHFFARHNILHLSPTSTLEPVLSGPLIISREHLQWFTTGEERKPAYNSDFPARLIETQLEWDDLILPPATMEQIEEIRNWILHGQRLLEEWEMNKKLQPGFITLFHGPPGTGKTLSASLLGKRCGRDVYRIDLSMIVSKYIGETEKNMAKVFDMAEHKRWILFFDEADALFGKRTRVDDSHDRYANQEVSFLLQRIEEFAGVVILASNLRTNMDDAFVRRFQSIIHFSIPKPSERLRIWRNAFSPKAELEERMDLERIAEKYELTGGTIMNVVRFASLKAVSKDSTTILLDDVEEGIRRELYKEGRAI